jgi:GTP-binding protein
VERTRVLVHMVDPTPGEERTPLADWRIINSELREYRAGLEKKPQIVVLNKMDTRPEPGRYRPLEKECRKLGIRFLPISAVTGEGIGDLTEAIWEKLQAFKNQDALAPAGEAAVTGGTGQSD